jgi:hypothetical protein
MMREVSVAVAERKRMYEIQEERNQKDDARGSGKRMKEIAYYSNLKLEEKEKEEVISKLQEEVERLRRRTFSSFENVNVPKGNVDQK